MANRVNEPANDYALVVASYLEGHKFPSDKQSMVAHASLQKPPQEVLDLLMDLPDDKMYPDLAKVIDELKYLKPK